MPKAIKSLKSILCLMAMLFVFNTQPVQARVSIKVSYSESADLFSLMDNVSGWLDGFTDPEYRKEWERRFGWSKSDQLWANRYRAYRTRTFIDDTNFIDPRTSANGIFASRDDLNDPLAKHFLAMPTAQSALSSLDSMASPNDVKMLSGFYKHFAPKWKAVLAENTTLSDKAMRLQKKLNGPAIDDFLQHISRFYKSSVDGEFSAFFTRYPVSKKSSAEVMANKYMLLHAPLNEVKEDYWESIIIHELVHYISAGQAEAQKRDLTARFLERCPLPKGAKSSWLLEEPLAVAWGQAAYSRIVRGQPLDPKENWYAIPWVNVVSRTLAPTIIEGYGLNNVLDYAIVDEAAERCKDLVAISLSLDTDKKYQ